MNKINIPSALRDADALQTRFAARIASRLDEVASQTSRDIDERLRFARERALEHARAARAAAQPAAQPVVQSIGGGTLALGGSGARWWTRLASVLPLVVLLAGLTLIQQRHVQAQIEAAAEIDAAILTDDLPPDAYSDPGFAEYLRVPAIE